MAMLQNDAARTPARRTDPPVTGLVRSLLASACTLLVPRRRVGASATTDIDGDAPANGAAHADPAVAAEQKTTGDAAAEHDALRRQLELAVADLATLTAGQDGCTPSARSWPTAE